MKLKMLENVMLDPGVSSGLHKFAQSRWDVASPEDRIRFCLAANIDIAVPAQIAKAKFNELPSHVQKQVIFNLTKHESLLR